MPIRRPATENVVVHASWWDADETVTLLPQLDYIQEMRAGKAAVQMPEGMTPETLRALPEEERAQVVAQIEAATEESYIHVAILNEMIVSSTLRYEATKEQKDAGQPGDMISLSLRTIPQLGAENITYLLGEVQKLDARTDPAEGMDPATFRPGDPAPALGEVPGSGEPADA